MNRTYGKVLTVVGVLTVLYALNFMAVSLPYSDVVNIHLLSQRQNYLILGGILFLAGVLVTLMTKPTEVACPHCAELIKREATVCKHCAREIARAIDDHKPTSLFDRSISNTTVALQQASYGDGLKRIVLMMGPALVITLLMSNNLQLIRDLLYFFLTRTSLIYRLNSLFIHLLPLNFLANVVSSVADLYIFEVLLFGVLVGVGGLSSDNRLAAKRILVVCLALVLTCAPIRLGLALLFRDQRTIDNYLIIILDIVISAVIFLVMRRLRNGPRLLKVNGIARHPEGNETVFYAIAGVAVFAMFIGQWIVQK